MRDATSKWDKLPTESTNITCKFELLRMWAA